MNELLTDMQMDAIAEEAFNRVSDYDMLGNPITDYHVLSFGPYRPALVRAFRAIEREVSAQLLVRINELEAQLARDTQHAARYRWLRQRHWSRSKLCVVTDPKANLYLGAYCPSEGLLDEEIDKAMEMEGN